MKALLDHNSPTVNNRKNGGDDLPAWLEKIRVTRFDTCKKRWTATTRTLAEYVRAVRTPSDAKAAVLAGNLEKKEDLPAWGLANDTGTNEGQRTGLFQIDFDHVETDVEALKSDLANVPGVLFAAKSASGKGVCALLYAPDLEGGQFASRAIADEMATRGHVFERDEKADKPYLLRFESYDPRPYIAETADPIAPDYTNAAEMLRDIEPATRLWRADTVDFEAAATAIAATAIAARARVRYGVPGREHTFPLGCDVQIVADSGACKSQGGVMILRKIAERVGAVSVGGMRTTDARIYDKLLEAAFEIQRDEKGKITGYFRKAYTYTSYSITDESGDNERSREGRADKAQANIIRRMACFDQEIELGETAEMARHCTPGVSIPPRIPCRTVSYRATTANQLDRQDMAGLMEGGNGRRTIYAKAKKLTRHFDVFDELAEKFGRIPSQDAQYQIMRLTDELQALFPPDAVEETDGDGKQERKPVVFTVNNSEIHTARMAAKFAFIREGIPEDWADTMIYNTAAWIAVLRCGIARIDTRFDQFEPLDIPKTITANDIYAATAIALNSWQVVRELMARGAAAQLAAARTDTEKTRLILDYIGGRPQKRIARGNLIRKFGRDVVSIVENMCGEGVIRSAIVKNAEGKNPQPYFEITPDGEVETEKAKYASTKSAPKAGNGEKTGEKSTAERCQLYADRARDWWYNPSANDDSLVCLWGKLRGTSIYANDPDGAKRWMIEYITSGQFDTEGRARYTMKDAKRITRYENA